MDFDDSDSDLAFRREAGSWLDDALRDVPDQEELSQTEREHWSRVWQERLCAGNWAGLSWPVGHGGRGMDSLAQAVFNEEAAVRGAPYPLNGVGMMLAGPTIIAHGSDEQQARYLPGILRGEEYWCQGFSEPGSGSDLASLRTAATRVDGGWLINGTKIWTSNAHNASRCLLLARTDPEETRHRGITYFLAPMDRFTVRPLVMINGDTEFNEMFLDDVFVPDSDVLGGVGNGWKVALTTLAFERGSMALNLWVWARQAVDRVVDLAIARGLADDSTVVDTIGALQCDAEAVRIGSMRMLAESRAGGVPGPETSALKSLWAGVVQNANRLAVQLDEAGGVLLDGAGAAARMHRYLRARAHTIEGGTEEVQKSILAERVLNLPRSR
ncbi:MULTISPECIES: acyl-CoA dehydrogenase family protein [unclassified Solwaraspora]|mgnify:FL=1|uniref:acyl-CoA dehydrogenase family protein n=1 Tax=unclassified Solwaraspora TaxID=2627926 RepID=UPI00248D1D1B|nr:MULTISPECIES: acyl-CoA dehydrogenase family protein [unclassified Solwaraspora]WBB99868.1 acyl-CoA dehydrogenase family protein [Solwaraspora sp. WMMA2059]WBC21584.1 acyl-CoA dehydrogenase family protein [Solwaraspora sp. WMMA2080]WJK36379.1 acyl-CoA dehydrogenase family protein [Solwaraspora sp. WMMA2065]